MRCICIYRQISSCSCYQHTTACALPTSRTLAARELYTPRIFFYASKSAHPALARPPWFPLLWQKERPRAISCGGGCTRLLSGLARKSVRRCFLLLWPKEARPRSLLGMCGKNSLPRFKKSAISDRISPCSPCSRPFSMSRSTTGLFF